MSAVKVALGRRLFADPRLSVTGRYSCASCHDPARAFTDGRGVAIGATGEALSRSAMTLFNTAYNITFGWSEPDVQSLEAQMLKPLFNAHPVELGLAGRQDAVCTTLRGEPRYARAFAAAFPESRAALTFDHVVKAIAAYERSLISGNSPFDRYVFNGEHDALTPDAKRGMALFFSPRAGCSACHSGLNFAGNWRDSQGETGSASFAGNGLDSAPMRVPTLRNIALTAPYMHDGRFPTLPAVLEHYASVAARARSQKEATADPRLAAFDLSAAERSDLIRFLESLTDPTLQSGR